MTRRRRRPRRPRDAGGRPDDTTTPQGADEPGFPQGGAKPGDGEAPANRQDRMDERLGDALEETFPSSGTVPVKVTR